jgi:plastocyanin
VLPARLGSRAAALLAAGVVSIGAAACGSSRPPPGRPATAGPALSASVRIVDFTFEPATVTVAVGGTVTWTQVDTVGHSVQSTTGAWPASRVLSTGQRFSHRFTRAGSYPYICGVHPYMTGTVVVVK